MCNVFASSYRAVDFWLWPRLVGRLACANTTWSERMEDDANNIEIDKLHSWMVTF